MNDFRYKDEPWSKDDSKEKIFPLIENNAEVLDLGCWTGRFGQKLKEKKSCLVYGADINPQALNIAKKRLDKVSLADLDQPNEIIQKIGNKQFDYILLIDVLEHLKSPELLLNVLPRLLKPHGKLIVSLPNVGHWTIRLNLLFGQFNYQETGLLDKTHLHLYTRESGRELLKSCCYKIKKELYTGASYWPSLKAFQFVFVAQRA